MPQAGSKCLVAALSAALLIVAPDLVLAQDPETPSASIRVLTLSTEGAPIGGLLVQILGPARQVVRETTSDGNGVALLAGLRRGSYELRIINNLYTDVYRVLDLRQAALVVEVTMLPIGVEERVTVTAARGTLQEETKIPATVRSLDEVRLKARAVDLLPRMLDEEPGILTQQTTPGQGSPILRGQSAQAVLYLLDGVRYNNATYRAGNTQYLAWIPDVAVDSVEVLLGPAGVNYGSDALGGAVNVISKPLPGFVPERTRWSGDVRVFGESASLGGGANMTLGGSGRNWAAYVAANASRHNDLRGGGGVDTHHSSARFLGLDSEQVRDAFGGRYQNTGYSAAGLTAKASLRTGSTGTLSGYLVRSEQYDVRRYDRLLGGDGRLVADFDPQQLTFGYLRYSHFSTDGFLEVTLSLNRQRDGRRDQRRPTDSLRTELNQDTALGVEVIGSRAVGSHLISGGIEVYDEAVHATRTQMQDGATVGVRPRVPNGATYRSLGFFVLDEWRAIGDRLLFSGGARYSAFRYRVQAVDNIIDGEALVPDTRATFDDLTFNLGANYAASDTLSAWGRVARGFRAPSVFDLGEIGLTGGGFEIAPDEAVGLGAVIGDSASRDAVRTASSWRPLMPEVLWSYEAGFRWFDDDVRVELTGFSSEFSEAISRRTVIVDDPVVGQTIGAQTILAQDSEGRIFVGDDPDPVVSRANIGRVRVWGLELLAQKSWGVHWLATLKASMQRGNELDTGFFARRIAPDNLTAVARWRSASGRLSIEALVKGARPQTRLNPGDLEDARIGAFRDADDITDFYANQGPRLGLVADGILLATGETLDQVIERVLGAGRTGAPLFTSTPGWVTLGIRGSYALADTQTLMFALSNLTDTNYRMHGSGFDAMGINLSLAYSVSF